MVKVGEGLAEGTDVKASTSSGRLQKWSEQRETPGRGQEGLQGQKWGLKATVRRALRATGSHRRVLNEAGQPASRTENPVPSRMEHACTDQDGG